MKNKGALYILAAAMLWGVIGIFIRNLERLGISSLNIVFLRCLFTVLILGAFLLIKSPAELKIAPRDIPLFAANGIFSVAMFTFCYYKTIELSTLSVAAVLMYTAPIFVMVISVLLFGERITVNKVVALVLSFAGCAFVSGIIGNAIKLQISAIVFGLLTGFGYSLYTVFSSRLILRGYKTFPLVFYTFLFALIGSFLILAFKGEISFTSYTPAALLWAFLLAVFSTVLPYYVYTTGLNYVDTSKAPIIATVEPVAATVLGLLYGEKLTLFGIFGIVLVLSSVILVNKKEKPDAS